LLARFLEFSAQSPDAGDTGVGDEKRLGKIAARIEHPFGAGS
jgi:hypothetical protein